MKVNLTLTLAVLVLLVADVSITAGSPLPGFAGMPDLMNMGHGFGAKIGNIIKGDSYDGLQRAMKKISSKRHGGYSSESQDNDSDSSSMLGFNGNDFEELLSMLEQSKTAPAQQPAAPGYAIPFAAIDNSVD